ncbi:hypothetical protein [endosymbiont GvMRE of Glomus versiforme]|uniref:hypothetical protein n=1 Tax=endosymbiont GvMRE of Glomus versiforme TaxID=2039283 RepID=UPI000EDF8EC3|nr:hypothetical protein [endosymbiont GvMRE of Glomus versiforme]RHZ36084.1 hypothetical protein GvMRE_Ic3g122 [endosymbiont GvMRE of Glomus versiforme]RHZ36822.1 hypothetical protein GvMRE_I2g169 [endosymbiont GvMRE of Glomus versiforme]
MNNEKFCDICGSPNFVEKWGDGKYYCSSCGFKKKTSTIDYGQQALANKSAEELREIVKEAKEVKKQIENLLNEIEPAIKVLKELISKSDKH